MISNKVSKLDNHHMNKNITKAAESPDKQKKKSPAKFWKEMKKLFMH